MQTSFPNLTLTDLAQRLGDHVEHGALGDDGAENQLAVLQARLQKQKKMQQEEDKKKKEVVIVDEISQIRRTGRIPGQESGKQKLNDIIIRITMRVHQCEQELPQLLLRRFAVDRTAAG